MGRDDDGAEPIGNRHAGHGERGLLVASSIVDPGEQVAVDVNKRS
jgi:hypothetical protein